MGELLKGKVLFPGTDCILYQHGMSPPQFSAFSPLRINLPFPLQSAPRMQTCGFAIQSKAFLVESCINRENFGINRVDNKTLIDLG